MGEVTRAAIVLAIEKAIPKQVTVWEAPYSRRHGDLDQQDRFAIVENAADAVLAALASTHNGGKAQ